MSISDRDQVQYTLLIDTDKYSGNFEREMFSFITGESECLGDEPHAEYEYDIARKELNLDGCDDHGPLFALLEERLRDPGDDGAHRTFVSIAPTPGFFNVHGEHYQDGYTGDLARDIKFCDYCKSGADMKKHQTWPAYQSVAIFISRKPTNAEIELIKSRAYAYSKLPKKFSWDNRPKILGFRLISETITNISENL
jgi:hypothetical protein